ncbi:MAG: hypothetical protein BM557_04285 [Flavobacterium sp. MedPE-SWcel]|uniref:hypothetical protein n=1 Tax=uncultured Flavobacterium sp. TaxID=165435 RepID=UPI00091D34F9|nr:hypothetical protein [uncultured Flavobacterium sp.]OIQ21474.1 MAG: hypothetical protein BM557_04285 [Flavobacterium sp. MedPE-SWcel]
MKSILLNPFERYTETQLIIAGILFTAIGCFLGYFFNCRFDGVLDFHTHSNIAIKQPFIDNGVNIVSLFIPFLILGKYINKKTRIIDILAVVIVSRVPLYLLSLINIGGGVTTMSKEFVGVNPADIQLNPLTIVILLIISIVSITLLVWFITLLYNGFKTASNAKTITHKTLFGVAILFAEGLSKYILSIIN